MFCECGTLISIKNDEENIQCMRCKRSNSIEQILPVLDEKVYVRPKEYVGKEVKGAMIKHECPSCGSQEMMYNAAQLRSADEGQTVFYSCMCGHKITMQS